MTCIGIICPPISGHLNPLIALGKELQKRGHQIIFVQIPDAQEKVEDAGLEFLSIGESDYPLGSMKDYFKQLSQLRGLAELRFTLQCGQKIADMICCEAPKVIQKAEIEILLVDQNEPAGSTIAEISGIPFVTICSSLALNREVSIPPVFTSWNYQNVWWANWRNCIGYFAFDFIIRSINTTINQYRKQWKLTPIKTPEDTFSSLAQISQQPAEFDFPRQALPLCFHYVGPFRNFSAGEKLYSQHTSTTVSVLEEDQLNQLPLVYASLGTLHNSKPELFHTIAEACSSLAVKLIISLGNKQSQLEKEKLPGNPQVVSYLPELEYRELLSKASLVITHAGFNTVLESLSNGLPLVALPMTMDQPATAARIKWTGAGEVIPLSQLNVSKLREAIKLVLSERSYRENAHKLRQSIKSSGGVVKAADIIEQLIRT